MKKLFMIQQWQSAFPLSNPYTFTCQLIYRLYLINIRRIRRITIGSGNHGQIRLISTFFLLGLLAGNKQSS